MRHHAPFDGQLAKDPLKIFAVELPQGTNLIGQERQTACLEQIRELGRGRPDPGQVWISIV
jgi:hypothetical protein